MRGKIFCGKNLLIIHLFRYVETRLPVNHKINDVKKL